MKEKLSFIGIPKKCFSCSSGPRAGVSYFGSLSGRRIFLIEGGHRSGAVLMKRSASDKNPGRCDW